MFSRISATSSNSPRQRLLLALACLSAISISGCGRNEARDQPQKTVIVRPSSTLLQPHELPLTVRVIGDYVDYSYKCEAELLKCNADKAGVAREVEEAELRRKDKTPEK